jgi:digeranylgeranylglycerophospholipid reductase
LKDNYEVLVVGAGPAGSSAAWAAARNGIKTIFIDKKKEVGLPVQCAEGIGSNLIPHLPFKIPKEQLIWKIDGISFHLDDLIIERTEGMWSGYAINREKFDKWLAENAIKAGADLHLSSELLDLETSQDYHVTNVKVKIDGKEKEIKPKVVIAADGVDSTVLKLLGFKIDFEKTGYVYGFELGGLSITQPNHDHIFLGDFAPGGYGYVFPLSIDKANVGIAALYEKDKHENLYERFMEKVELRDLLNNRGYVIKEKKGLVPFLFQTEDWQYGNVLLTGDTANQNIKPFVEGFLPGIICGNIAGKSAAQHILEGNPLKSYTTNIMDKMNDMFNHSNKVGEFLYEFGKFSDDKMDIIRVGISSAIFSLDEINVLKKLNFSEIKSIMIKRYKNP